ncbi:hypothetical protein ACIQWA_13030, partial [Kitasatospora sp. NPDC098652]
MSAVNEQPTPSGLRRTLGVRDLMVYGLLFIAPMAPVGVFGVLDARSHGAVAAVYLAATVAMGFTAFSYAQMVRAVPQTGSVFAYARAGLGEGPGFIAGWMAMLDYLLIPIDSTPCELPQSPVTARKSPARRGSGRGSVVV